MPRQKMKEPDVMTKEMEIGARMLASRKAIGMKRPELAQRLGVKPNTIYRYEIGSIGINDSMKVAIARELGITLEYLVLGQGEDASEQKIPHQIFLPILDHNTCAEQDFNPADMQSVAIKQWMPWLKGETGGPVEPAKPYFVQVEGDSMMGAGIHDGSLILINPNAEVNSGDIAYVRWNGRCSARGIIYYQDGHIELRPANKDFSSVWIEKEEAESIKVLGKVVRWMKIGVPNHIF